MGYEVVAGGDHGLAPIMVGWRVGGLVGREEAQSGGDLQEGKKKVGQGGNGWREKGKMSRGNAKGKEQFCFVLSIGN